MQLRPALLREIDCRPSGGGRALRPVARKVARKQYLLRETAHFQYVSSLSSSPTVPGPCLPQASLRAAGMDAGGKLPLFGLSEDGEHLLCQRPPPVRRQVPGVDGLTLALEAT